MGWLVGVHTDAGQLHLDHRAAARVARAPGRATLVRRAAAENGSQGVGDVRARRDRRLQDVRQVPVPLIEVEPVPDDEPVWTIESRVSKAIGHDPPGGLFQERAEFQRAPPRGRSVEKR